MSTRLDRQSFWDARAAVEAPPGRAGTAEQINREQHARYVLTLADLSLFSPQSPGFRELTYVSIGAAALVSGIVAIAHPRGFRVHSIINRSAVQVFMSASLNTVAAVRALAGFVAGGVAIRTGLTASPDLLFVSGTATNPIASTNGWNLLGGGQDHAFDPPLWVPPDRALVMLNPVVNSGFDVLFDLSAPGVADGT